ncbi:MAG: autotransporter outer membrane beta-barrel domain-containing protein [Gammaproteobacteria bacterium]
MFPHHFCRSAYLGLGFIGLLGFAAIAQAQTDISGTYTGTLTGSESCPSEPQTNESVNMTLTISQNGAQFEATASFIDDDGPGSATISGVVSDDAFAGAGSGTGGDGTTFTITNFEGGFGGDHIFITNLVAADDGPPYCITTLSGRLDRTGGTTTGGTTFNPEVTPGSSITSILLTGIQVRAIASDVSGRVGNVLRGIGKSGAQPSSTGFRYQEDAGRNAGDSILGYGVWSSYSYSDFKDNFVSTAFSGQRHSVLGGFDISPWESTIIGLAVGYETSDLKTRFNQGESDSDGFTIAPYFGALLTDNASVDASIGYSRISFDQFRTDTITGQRITSKPDTDRFFATFNGSVFKSYDAWTFTGQAGFLYARNSQDDFVESNGAQVAKLSTSLGQVSVAGEVAYGWNQFEPFARVGYEHDFSRVDINIVGGGPQPSNDNDNFLVGAGVRYYSANGITGNIEWNKRLGRSNFSEDVFTVTIRGQF